MGTLLKVVFALVIASFLLLSTLVAIAIEVLEIYNEGDPEAAERPGSEEYFWSEESSASDIRPVQH
jgi:hypothetical protein